MLKAPALPLHTKQRVEKESLRAHATRHVTSLRVVVWGGSMRGKGGRGSTRDEVYVRTGARETLLRWSVLGESTSFVAESKR